MKKFNLMLLTVLSIGFIFSVSCKKSKGIVDDGETAVSTKALVFARSESIYGGDYTFALQFEGIGEVKEYGIVYKAWIKDTDNKIPMVGTAGSTKIIFGEKPGSQGVAITKKVSITFTNFNDANYRAYAILKSGEMVYGESMYFVST